MVALRVLKWSLQVGHGSITILDLEGVNIDIKREVIKCIPMESCWPMAYDSTTHILEFLKLQFISSSTFVSTVANSCRVSASAAQGTAANTWVRRQELWESPCFAPAFGTTLDLSQIPLSWQLYRFPSLSLSSFHQCWQ